MVDKSKEGGSTITLMSCYRLPVGGMLTRSGQRCRFLKFKRLKPAQHKKIILIQVGGPQKITLGGN